MSTASIEPPRSQAYFDSPWPGEDGGPQRLQIGRGATGLDLRSGGSLGWVSRNIMMGTMTVLGAPGEVYLLMHSMLRSRIGLPTTARVERIDPNTLATLECSPALAGGPMWPGGMAIHGNGKLYVVYGRYAHRLSRSCELQASLELPINQAYNSFVILDNGLLVTKNLSDSTPAHLTVIDPDSLRPVCTDLVCPEASIARLSAIGNTVYMVGVRSIMRYHFDAARGTLELDRDWRFDYIGTSSQSYGWDVVLDGDNAWFMDNGHHRYLRSMIGAGVSPTPNRLIRVSMHDARDHQIVTVGTQRGGSITNPPLYDTTRRLIIGYDSANRYLRAWRYEPSAGTLTPQWDKPGFACASHMLQYPQTGELVINDYRRNAEEVAVLDIETGDELGRVRTGGLTQGVVFPSTGWGRDFYWTTFGRLARIFVH